MNWDPPGPGPWQQDRAHTPNANTRIMVELYPEPFGRGFAEGLGRYGSLLDRLAMGIVNGFIYHQVQPFDMPGPAGPLTEAEIGAEIGRRATVAEQALVGRIWRDDIRRWDDELKPAAIARHRELYAVDLAGLDAAGLTDHVDACLSHVGDMVFQHHRFNISAMFAVGDFMLHVAPMVGRPPESLLTVLDGYSAVSGPLPPEMVPVVAALRSDPESRALVDGDGDPADRLVELTARSEAAAELVRSTGFRLVDGFDVVNPTLGERPEFLMGKLAAAQKADPDAARNRADDAAAELRAGLAPDEAAVFDEKLADARLVYRLRDERGMYSDISAIGLLRLALLEVGRRAVADGRLPSADLVLDADAAEVREVIEGGGPSADELAERARVRTSLTRDDAPRFLGPPPPEPPPVDGLPPALARLESGVGFLIGGVLGELDEPVGDDQTIGGISASPGSYDGPARHVWGVDDLAAVCPGDVLVAPATSEAFNSVVHLVGAIVTDHGSFASHAGIVAREVGFPAVVGTTNATARIPAGASVRVDGDSGEVTVLS